MCLLKSDVQLTAPRYIRRAIIDVRRKFIGIIQSRQVTLLGFVLSFKFEAHLHYW